MRDVMSFLVALFISTPAWAAPPVDRELEAAARNFRISTYQNYRTQRAEYDRRMEIGNEALKRFYLANDDLGRTLVRNWFHEANSNGQFLPQVPTIELAASAPRLNVQTNTARSANKTPTQKDGFNITKFDSNPRFRPQFPNSQSGDAKHDATLVSEEGSGSIIKKTMKNPGSLFSSIGKSFLRGDKNESGSQDEAVASDKAHEFDSNQDHTASGPRNTTTIETTEAETKSYENVDDPFAPVQADPSNSKFEVEENPVSADAEAGDETESLNSRIMNFNLTVEMLNEDFAAEQTKSIEVATLALEQLEAADDTFQKIFTSQELLSSEERDQLTPLASLEPAATRVMTMINELSTRLSAGQLENAGDDTQQKLDELRMRVSKIMASQSL